MNDSSTFDPSTEDPAAADRLRRTLSAVATAVPTEDRSAELLAALGDRPAPPSEPVASGTAEPTVISLSDLRRPAHRRRWLAAAAAVVVAGLGAAALLGSDDQKEQVIAEPGATGTGWYLPAPGWDVVSVQADFLDAACPCTYWMAADTGTDPAVIDVVEAPAGAVEVPSVSEPVDVGGRTGMLSDGPFDVLLVTSGDRQLVVQGRDADHDALISVADAWLDDRDAGEPVDAAGLPLPDGFERSALVEKVGRRSEHLLAVRFREATTGREVELQFVPTGYNRAAALIADSMEAADGRFRFTAGAGTMPGSGSTINLAGYVGGPVDVLAGDSFFGDEIEPLPADDLAEFVDGLRQVSTAEWRAALAGADGQVDPDVLDAPSLFEAPLVDG